MTKRKFDRHELQMLDILQENGRMTVSDLAERTGLSATPCARRFETLQRDRVIRGFRAMIDRKAVGLDIEVFVQVSLLTHAGHTPAAFRQAIGERDEVTACWALTGDHDFLLNVMVPDVEALNRFLMKHLMAMPGVRDVKTNLVLENVKGSRHVPLNHIEPR